MVYSPDRRALAEKTKSDMAAPGVVIVLLLWPSKPEEVGKLSEELKASQACFFMVDRVALNSRPAMDMLRRAVEMNLAIGLILPEQAAIAVPEFAKHLAQFSLFDSARVRENVVRMAGYVSASLEQRGPFQRGDFERAKARSTPIVVREPPPTIERPRAEVVTVQNLLAPKKAGATVTRDPEFRPFLRDRLDAYFESLRSRAREMDREGEVYSKAERAGRYLAPLVLLGAGIAAWRYHSELNDWFRDLLSKVGLSKGMAVAAPGVRTRRFRRKRDRTIAHVLAPARVKPDEKFNLTVYIAVIGQEQIKPMGSLRADPVPDRFPLDLAHGDRVRVEIHPRGLVVNAEDIDRHERGKKWEGDSLQFGFEVVIPGTGSENAVLPQLLIYVNDDLRTESPLSIQRLRNALKEPPSPVAVMGEGKVYDHIFVSYSRMDRALVRRHVRRLQRRCKSIFFDEESLQIAGEWPTEISESIKKANVFALFWSEPASQSEWVAKELDYAWQLQKGSAMPIFLPHNIGRFNWRRFAYVWPPIPERLKVLHFDRIRQLF
jgi:hypothetical protein